jgi:hypothetical protein
MKTRILIAALVVAWGTCPAQDVTWSQSGLSDTIPEGNPVGISFADNISSAPGEIVQNVTVDMNTTGGYNGDMIAYLVSPNGTEVSLLNLPGVTTGTPFGNAGSGFTITLADGNPGITASTGSPGATVTGPYAAAGSLSSFAGGSINGTWTLFLADVGYGAGSPTLTGFTVDITPVPEPANVALGIFGVLLGGLGGFRWYRRSRQLATVCQTSF